MGQIRFFYPINFGNGHNVSIASQSLYIYRGINASTATIATLTLTNALTIGNGGTEATTASAARTNLGLAIGSDVQAYDADLDDLADVTLSGSKVGSGVPAANIATGNLGTGVIASSLAATGFYSHATVRSNLGLAIGTDVPSPTGTGASGTWGIGVTGNAATVTTNANLTGDVTSVGNATTLATVPVTKGGTGATTLTGLLQGNGTSALTGITNSSTVGQTLRVTGASTYGWGALDLADTDATTGSLVVGSGGTGAATFTSNGVIYGNGTGALLVTSQGAANSILTANAGAPSFSATPTITSLTTTGSASIGTTAQTGSANRFRYLQSIARVYASGALSISWNTVTAITWDSESFDVDTLHSTASNTSRFTVNIAGKYQVFANINWATGLAATDYVYTYIYVNGAATSLNVLATQGNISSGIVSNIVNLAATDYVEIFVYQAKGAGGAHSTRGGATETYATITYIGE